MLIRVQALIVLWLLWQCRNDKVFNDKIVLSCRSSTGVLVFSFVVTSSDAGEPQPIYGGLYTVERYKEGYFFPIWVAA
jgi:hypothetical protein